MQQWLTIALLVLLTGLPVIVSTDARQRRGWAILAGIYLSLLLIAGVNASKNSGSFYYSGSEEFFVLLASIAPFNGMAGFILLGLRPTRLSARARTIVAATASYTGYVVFLAFWFGLIGG